MAKQAEDKMTRDMYMAAPGRRGRPPKADGAMSAAERKRAQRKRDKDALFSGNYAESLKAISIEGLLAECSLLIAEGKHDSLMEHMTAELKRRFDESAAKRDSHKKAKSQKQSA